MGIFQYLGLEYESDMEPVSFNKSVNRCVQNIKKSYTTCR